MVSLIAVLAVANSLRSDDESNPEYDAALVDLATGLMPGDQDVARQLVEYIVLETRPPASEYAPVPMSLHVNAVG